MQPKTKESPFRKNRLRAKAFSGKDMEEVEEKYNTWLSSRKVAKNFSAGLMEIISASPYLNGKASMVVTYSVWE